MIARSTAVQRARGALALLAAVAIVLVAVVGSATRATAGEGTDVEVQRVFVFSLPGLTWEESQGVDLPNLEAFFETAALADLAPRSVRFNSRPGDAYLTIAAGTRSIGDPERDGQVLEVDEQFSGSAAGDIFQRRTGTEAAGGSVALEWPRVERLNRAEPYDAVPGLLAATLRSADVRAAAVGNADGSDEPTASYERQAGLAMIDTDGVLAAGTVGRSIVELDAQRPFGVRLRAEVALDEFATAWDASGRAVVLVEASDLARVMRYRGIASSDHWRDMREQALTEADDLFGKLMRSVDPAHDAVIVLAPYGLPGRTPLTIAALGGVAADRGGYLRSASTQRAGVVSLVDVAPTILDLLDIERPVDMEGRPFEVSNTSASLGERRDHLVHVEAASQFREHLLFPTTLAVVLVLALVAAAATVVTVRGASPRQRNAVAFVALADLAALPGSYVARAFPLEDLGVGFYWMFVVGFAAAVAAIATGFGRRRGGELVPLTIVLAVVALTLVADVTTGSRLHMSAAFGYSPTGNSRLYGISNYSFGQLAASVSFLAAFVAARLSGRAAWLGALGMMVALLVVLGVPIWGSDVGGILAFTPTIIVFGLLLSKRTIRWRTVLIGIAVTAAALVAFGFIDLARPPEQRAHLGRLFERIGDEGLQPLLSIVQRKAAANLRVSVSSFWVAAIPIAAGFMVFLSRWHTRPLAALAERVSTLRVALVASIVAAILGSLVNDSGAIVGGVALFVVAATLVHLAMRLITTPDASSP